MEKKCDTRQLKRSADVLFVCSVKMNFTIFQLVHSERCSNDERFQRNPIYNKFAKLLKNKSKELAHHRLEYLKNGWNDVQFLMRNRFITTVTNRFLFPFWTRYIRIYVPMNHKPFPFSICHCSHSCYASDDFWGKRKKNQKWVHDRSEKFVFSMNWFISRSTLNAPYSLYRFISLIFKCPFHFPLCSSSAPSFSSFHFSLF